MMRNKHWIFNLTLLAALLLGACAPASPTPEAMMDKPTEAMMDKPTEAMMDKPTEAMMDKPTDDNMGMSETPTPEAMMDAPAWFGYSLTDVNTGETFTIGDFKGKVILLETMAVWCSNCRKQQQEVKALHERLGMNEGFVSIALDIDSNETADVLKAHATKNGFDWLYAVSSTDLSRQVASLYGDQFLNPPSVPMLIIDRHGEVHVLPFGVKSADKLYEQVIQYLDGGM
jgi:thiol-disulfide isomerase/thioredoxin